MHIQNSENARINFHFQGQSVSAMGSNTYLTDELLGNALKVLHPVENGLQNKLTSLDHVPYSVHCRCYVDLDSDCPDVRPSNNGAPYAWSCRCDSYGVVIVVMC